LPDLLGFACRKKPARHERLKVFAAVGIKPFPTEKEIGAITFGTVGIQ
jgi:hypothetical protein